MQQAILRLRLRVGGEGQDCAVAASETGRVMRAACLLVAAAAARIKLITPTEPHSSIRVVLSSQWQTQKRRH